MNENPTVEVHKLQPITKFIYTLGVLPTSYLMSMTYPEQLTWLCNYISQTVIPAINDNVEAVQELQQLYKDLEDFVNNYFDNLDVQEEINRKLDEMASSGQLTEIIKHYVDPFIQEQDADIEAFKNSVTTELEGMDIKIDSAVSGSPLVASSTDEMTDTTRVYVNTTDGKWYYYDGEEWQIGGTYQSSENSDDVNGLVEITDTYNMRGLLDWEVGNLNNSTGEVTTSVYLLITPDIITANEDLYIDYSSYTTTTIYKYNNDDSYDSYIDIGQNANKGYFIFKGQKFRLKLNYVDDSNRHDISAEEPRETNLYLGLKIYKYKDFENINLALLNSQGYWFDVDDLKYTHSLILGDFGSGLVNQNKNSYKRMVTPRILKYPKSVVISSKVAAQAYIWYFDDVNGTNPSGQGWKDIYNTPFVVSANQCFRYIVSSSSSATEALLTPYDNAVFKNLSVKYYDAFSSEPNPNIKYIDSVCHQGYSESESYNRCKAGGYTLAKQHGFNWGECDIQFTSDGIPVCAHDASFVSDGLTVVISEHTFSDLQNYDYYGSTIASFEAILTECKTAGLGLYIDHINGLNDTKWNSLFSIVKKLQMEDNVKWLQPLSREITNRILTWYKKSKIAIVTSASDLTDTIAEANAIKTDFNEISIDAMYSNFTTTQISNAVALLNPGVKLEVWTIDTLATCQEYLPYVSGITSNKYSVIDMIDN